MFCRECYGVQRHFFVCISSFPTFCSAVPTSPIIHCCFGSVKESPAAFLSFFVLDADSSYGTLCYVHRVYYVSKFIIFPSQWAQISYKWLSRCILKCLSCSCCSWKIDYLWHCSAGELCQHCCYGRLFISAPWLNGCWFCYHVCCYVLCHSATSFHCHKCFDGHQCW